MSEFMTSVSSKVATGTTLIGCGHMIGRYMQTCDYKTTYVSA